LAIRRCSRSTFRYRWENAGEADQQDQPETLHTEMLLRTVGATERSMGHAGRADESSGGFSTRRRRGSRPEDVNSSGRLWIVAARFGDSSSHCDVAELLRRSNRGFSFLLCIAASGGSRRHTGRPHEKTRWRTGRNSREDGLGRAREDAFQDLQETPGGRRVIFSFLSNNQGGKEPRSGGRF